MARPTGLSAFKRKPERSETLPSTSEEKAQERKRGKGETVALTVRLTRGQWERVHHLALSEGISIQNLCITGLSKVFKEKGLQEL